MALQLLPEEGLCQGPCPSHSTLIFLALVFIIWHITILAVWRLLFHPLSKIPGPRLAAINGLYGFYHNAIADGKYSLLFPKLHRKYNTPVIRIGPNAVHVDDPDFYQEMFSITTKYYKEPGFYKALGAEGAMASILDPKEHRVYRNHLRPLFASRSVDAVVPKLKVELRKATLILEKHRAQNRPLNIQSLYRSFTSDMICELLFMETLDFIGQGDGYHPFVAALDKFTAYSWLVVYFPWIKSIHFYLPFGLGQKLTPEFTEFKRQCQVWQEQAMTRRRKGIEKERKSLFDYYLELNTSPDTTIRTVPQPMEDAFNFLTAGTESTTYSLSCTTFHLLNNPEVLRVLRRELDESVEFIRDSFDHKRIQALPYLAAVVKETMRLSTAVPGCLPRVTPPEGATVGSIFIPGGTTVSASHLTVVQNERIFPEPFMFKPERWLGEKGKALEKWHVGFSKGPRRCIGMNLAYLEIFCTIAYLFSRYEMKLFETGPNSMQWVDRISARNRADVKVEITADRWNQ